MADSIYSDRLTAESREAPEGVSRRDDPLPRSSMYAALVSNSGEVLPVRRVGMPSARRDSFPHHRYPIGVIFAPSRARARGMQGMISGQSWFSWSSRLGGGRLEKDRAMSAITKSSPPDMIPAHVPKANHIAIKTTIRTSVIWDPVMGWSDSSSAA